MPSLYIYSHIVGKDNELPVSKEKTVTHCVVMKLLEGLGHHIFMDNFYTSPSLFKEMGKNEFGAAVLFALTEKECQRSGKHLEKERKKQLKKVKHIINTTNTETTKTKKRRYTNEGFRDKYSSTTMDGQETGIVADKPS